MPCELDTPQTRTQDNTLADARDVPRTYKTCLPWVATELQLHARELQLHARELQLCTWSRVAVCACFARDARWERQLAKGKRQGVQYLTGPQISVCDCVVQSVVL